MTKILFYCPSFYEFEREILNELQRNADYVSYFFVDEFKDLQFPFLIKLSLKLANILKVKSVFALTVPFVFHKLNREIMSNVKTEYDLLIVIKGYGVSRKTVSAIKAKKKILYQWDDVSKFPSVTHIYDLFDAVYTFSRQDSENNLGTYLPNFATKSVPNGKRYDRAFFIGEYSAYRLEILESLALHLVKLNIECDFSLVDLNNKCTADCSVIQIISVPVERSKYEELSNSSSIHIDISRYGNATRTQRYQNALFNAKGLITDYQDDQSLSVNEILNLEHRSRVSELMNSRASKPLDNVMDIAQWLDKLLQC